MVISVDMLRQNLNQLNKLIDDYNYSILNLYKELSFSNNYWQDNHSLIFFDNIELEKRKNFNLVSELTDVKNIYEKLINEYGQIGKNIKCTLKNKNSVLVSMDDYLNKMNEIINLYSNLDLSFCSHEAKYLENHLYILKNNYKKVEVSRNTVKYYFEKIENIEKEVSLNISKINIEYLKEMDYRDVL